MQGPGQVPTQPSAQQLATPREPAGLCLPRAGSCGPQTGCDLTRVGAGFKSKLIITGLPRLQTSLSGHVAKPSGDSTHKPSEASVSVLSHMLFWNFPTAPSKRGLSFPSP